MDQLTHAPTGRHENGFTLIELMVAMVILGIVLTGVVQMFIQTGRYHTAQEKMVTTSQDLRAAKMLMVQEIREAGLNPTDVADIGFQPGTAPNFIHLTRDQYKKVGGVEVDGYDGKTDGSNEDISYYRTDDDCTGVPGAVLPVFGAPPPPPKAGCLRRDTGGGGQPIMPNVTNLRFDYYAKGNPLPIDPATLTNILGLKTIRTVEVTITGRVEDTGRVAETEQTLQFRILARNM